MVAVASRFSLDIDETPWSSVSCSGMGRSSENDFQGASFCPNEVAFWENLFLM